MHFLLVLFAYVIQRRFDLSIGQQLDSALQQGQRRLLTGALGSSSRGWLLYGLTVLMPVLILVCVIWLSRDWFFGVLSVFVELLVLFLTLGSPHLKQQMDAYLTAWRHEQFQSAYHQAQQLGFPLSSGIEKPRQLHGSVWRGFLYRSFSRYFNVIFWFMVAGAAGALLVRLSNQVAQKGETVEVQWVAAKVSHVLDWIPARLLAITFAVAGNFSDCLSRCKSALADPAGKASLVLGEAAEGALSSSTSASAGAKPAEHDVQQVLDLRDLLNRSVLVWFAVLAVLVLAGFS